MKKPKNTPPNMPSKLRLIVFLTFLLAITTGVVLRLIYIETKGNAFLENEGNKRTHRLTENHAYRGTIVDRNGYPLAVSTPVSSIWVDPRYIELNSSLNYVFNLLDLSKEQKLKLVNRIEPKLGRSGFVYLKRQVNPMIAQQIDNLNIPGIYLENEYKRYYPDGEVAAHVIGYTNIDGKGQEGIELKYNEWLSGNSGKSIADKDLKGNLIKTLNSPDISNGHDIALSIDRRIQYIAYKALQDSVKENIAKSGSAIVLDAETGEILAMVNQPSYNPNNLKNALPETRRNRAVTDVFEPGSTIKSFSALMALATDEYSPESIIHASPGYYRVGKRMVRDFKDYGDMDIGYILQKSSNVGISKIVLSLPHEKLSDTLLSAGFGHKTDIEFPGEQAGYVPTPAKWGEFPLATLSFGYGMNSTALQLAQAYTTIADQGNMIKPSLIRLSSKNESTKVSVTSSKVANDVLKMLNSVVEGNGATGRRANLENYHIAGKTGTVRRPIPGGYATDSYTGIFAGIAPVSHPKLVIVTTIDDAKSDNYGGGSAAAPMAAKILEKSLEVLGIPPDKIKA
ncbi:penicillin-binding protein 2 [Francisellaceae bacterium]|nr:penicillin-binding protein 2 [Francisellaceae bacterium]